MDKTYCYEKCSVGKAASESCLAKNNSVFDAAYDFHVFIEKCFETCPFKGEHKKSTLEK